MWKTFGESYTTGGKRNKDGPDCDECAWAAEELTEWPNNSSICNIKEHTENIVNT